MILRHSPIFPIDALVPRFLFPIEREILRSYACKAGLIADSLSFALPRVLLNAQVWVLSPVLQSWTAFLHLLCRCRQRLILAAIGELNMAGHGMGVWVGKACGTWGCLWAHWQDPQEAHPAPQGLVHSVVFETVSRILPFGNFHLEPCMLALNCSPFPTPLPYHAVHDLLFWKGQERNGLLVSFPHSWRSWALPHMPSFSSVGEIRCWDGHSWLWAVPPSGRYDAGESEISFLTLFNVSNLGL